jgi:tyrosyl-tRNA synthetase
MSKDVSDLLSRGVDKIYPSKEALQEVLESGKKLKLYQGFDPTGDKLHIGHMIGLRKLADWQALGHKVIFLIGDFTGMIGDPSGKTESRKMLSKEVVLKNAENYKNQAAKILKFEGVNPIEIKYNSEWLEGLGALEFVRMAGLLSVQQVVKRDLFRERINQGQDLFMNEFLYPVMQAYDSVAMDVDVEIGGTDQMFNMLMGRDLMRHMKKKEKFVMTTPILTDATGKKIGKTEGNIIALDDEPGVLFGKIMSLPDEVVVKGFEYLTRVPMDRVEEVKRAFESGENPMLYKKELAHEIVKDLNSATVAETAQGDFEKTFSKGGIPENLQSVRAPADKPLAEILIENGMISSKSEFNRLAKAGAIEEKENGVYRVGKHRFLRIERI